MHGDICHIDKAFGRSRAANVQDPGRRGSNPLEMHIKAELSKTGPAAIRILELHPDDGLTGKGGVPTEGEPYHTVYTTGRTRARCTVYMEVVWLPATNLDKAAIWEEGSRRRHQTLHI